MPALRHNDFRLVTGAKIVEQPDPRNLLMRAFVNMSVLPTPPAKLDRLSKVLSHRPLGMYGNDRYGNCTIAAAAHIEMTTGRSIGNDTHPSEKLVIDKYKQMTGCIAPGDMNDSGLYLLDVMKEWQHNGIARHKIGPYVALRIDDWDLLPHAMYLFAVEIGFASPPNIFDDFWAFRPWDGGPPALNEGHAVNPVDYPDGWGGPNIPRLVTWGRDQRFTQAWWRQYVFEAWVVMPADWTKRDPIPGVDYAGLEAALAGLHH